MEANGYGSDYANVVGLRADEPGRVAKGRMRGSVMPLADAGITNRDVRAFWRKQDFDLQLLPFEGNCDGCFLKGRAKLLETERTSPGTLQWWSDIENGPGKGTFSKEHSYAELIRAARHQGDLFRGAFDNDPDMDAECGAWCGEAA